MEQSVSSKIRGFLYTDISCWTVNQKSHQQRIILFSEYTVWNVNVEVVQAWRGWYFSHVTTIKGRQRVE